MEHHNRLYCLSFHLACKSVHDRNGNWRKKCIKSEIFPHFNEIDSNQSANTCNALSFSSIIQWQFSKFDWGCEYIWCQIKSASYIVFYFNTKKSDHLIAYLNFHCTSEFPINVHEHIIIIVSVCLFVCARARSRQ